MSTATAVKERPIIFSAPMVRAILDGRKTQTRRVVKLKEPFHLGSGHFDETHPNGREKFLIHGPCGTKKTYCLYGVTGDRLWVRETWSSVYHDHQDGDSQTGDVPFYKADYDGDPTEVAWKPSIHMPRWASRITLEITDVRVQRLQDISEADAIAEGAQCAGVPASLTNRGAFAKLWESIHGNGAWDANPWLWCITFKRVEA